MASRSPTLSREDVGSDPGTLEAGAVHPEPGPGAYCKLCLSELPSAATRELQGCDCVFCTTCLERYVQLAIVEGGGAPITCPDMACLKTGVLLDSEIASLAPEDQVELYQRVKFERGSYYGIGMLGSSDRHGDISGRTLSGVSLPKQHHRVLRPFYLFFSSAVV